MARKRYDASTLPARVQGIRTGRFGPHASPLGMMTTEPELHNLVTRLQKLRRRLRKNPHKQHIIEFSRADLIAARNTFDQMILNGERALHRLSKLLCETFVETYQLRSVIIGEIEATGRRFTLTQDITDEDLNTNTDIQLGTRMLDPLRFANGQGWSRAALVANVVDYQPTEPNPHHIHHINSRIKAEEEIWNKVVDEIFELDSLVTRDKKLRHMSRYVKDIFGIKIVVGEVGDVHPMLARLREAQWEDAVLAALDITPQESTRALQFLEMKDYISEGEQKQSGWEALKVVVRWWDKTFEIQIQSLRNFLREREVLTTESHDSFKWNREKLRERIAERMPLFRFYRDLLRWLFLNPEGEPPSYEGVTVRLVE